MTPDGPRGVMLGDALMRDPSVRASDADREAVASTLREHIVVGRLTMEEFDQRIGAAYSATTVGELDSLLKDLPRPAEVPTQIERSRKDNRSNHRTARKYEKQLAKWQEQRQAHEALLLLARQYRGESWPEMVCKPGETVFAKLASTALIEERRAPGRYQGRSSGVSIPLGFGLRYRTGRSTGRYMQGNSMPTVIDVGIVYLTNKRVVFRGPKQTRECLFDKTLGVDHDRRSGTTVVSVANRQKPMVIRYGPKVAGWFVFRMDLALAHHKGVVPALVSGLEHELAQIDASKPVPPSTLDARRIDRIEDKVVGQNGPATLLDPDWKYFASEVARGMQEHESEYQDYELGIVRRTAHNVADPNADIEHLGLELARLVAEIGKQIEQLTVETAVTQRPGSDWHTFHRRLSDQIVEVYSSMIEWAQEVRASTVPSEWQPVYSALLKCMEQPLHQIREFSAKATQGINEGITVEVHPLAIKAFADAVAQVQRVTATQVGDARPQRVPHPPNHEIGWGVLFFASEVARGIADHEHNYERYVRGEADSASERIIDPPAYLKSELQRLSATIAVVNRLLQKSATLRAFGPGGRAGDEAAILDMAGGLTRSYADVIAFGLRTRGAAVSHEWLPVVQAFAEMVKPTITKVRDFSETLAQQAQIYFEALRAGRSPDGPLNLTLTLDLDISLFQAEIAKLKQPKPSASSPWPRQQPK